jgi:hypothetical protein
MKATKEQGFKGGVFPSCEGPSNKELLWSALNWISGTEARAGLWQRWHGLLRRQA